tara:strand:- start:5478 stop:6236 length:759 start_codon:yes stop_codon:yes gene_type:complete
MADPLFSSATGTTSYRNLFHNKISTWSSGIPLQTSWVVRFSFPGITNFTEFYKNIGADINMESQIPFGIAEIDQMRIFNTDINTLNGCFYIQSMKLPVESFATKDADLDPGAGGFLTGIVGSDRAKNSSRSLTIDFLETNLDFIDLIIRPWMVTAAYRGLLARKHKPFKADIDVVQYTRSIKYISASTVEGASKDSESDKRSIRKHYQFFDCVPTNIPGNSLTYTAEEIKTLSVQWTYNRYRYTNAHKSETQ